MPQDRQSGAEASHFGRENAARIAQWLGAVKVGEGNEYEWKGQRVTIHSARPKTKSVGVTYDTLDRIAGVIGAFQRDDGSFDLYLLAPQDFHTHMRETRSRGAAAGKVGIVAQKVFEDCGQRIDIFRG